LKLHGTDILIRTLALLLALFAPIAWADFENDLSATGENINALRELRLKAGTGDANAQLQIGSVFFKGRQLDQDYAEAVKWFRLAAMQGLAEAQYNLGMMYATGRGVPQDFAQAVSWYRLAADQHLAIAELNLGVACNYGEGVKKDEAQALKWFRLAAEQNEAVAQFNLAAMYANGQGVERNLTESHRWAKRAVENGYEIARALMEDIEQRMASPDRTGETAAHIEPQQDRDSSDKGIYLQLGAFRTQNQAAEFLEKMQARLGDIGKPYRLFTNEGWIRIQVGPYPGIDEARQVATGLKSRTGYEPKVKRH
jgi:TPR repeat protein